MTIVRKLMVSYEYRKIIRSINRIMKGAVLIQEASDIIQLPNAKPCNRRGYVANYKGTELHLIAYYQMPVVVKGCVSSAAAILKINGFKLTEAHFEFLGNDTNRPIRGGYKIKT